MTENDWIDFLKKELNLEELQGQGKLEFFTGSRSDNEYRLIPNCNEPLQFGDLRVEALDRRIIIEIESEKSGGTINFLKFLPYLMGEVNLGLSPKDFCFFQIYDEPGYPSYRALTKFLYERCMPKAKFLLPSQFCFIDDGANKRIQVASEIRNVLSELYGMIG